MLRPALIAMSLLLVSLVALTLIPGEEPSVPEATITLVAPELTLYPEADPDAVWHFAAEHATYDTSIRETVLTTIYDGQRVLDDEVDFTLTSDRVTIDRSDNLRSPQMDVHLLDSNWFLDMQSKGSREVFINQRQGKFEVPILTYTGDGIGESRDENVRMNFDLTDFEAGGPDSIGYNRFLDDGL